MEKPVVWDRFVRVFHWSLVASFFINMFLVDDDGKIHEYLGYLIVGLIALRIVWGFIGPQQARFKSFPPSLPRAIDHLLEIVRDQKNRHKSHSPLGALMIYNLLISLTFLALTGYMMTTIWFFGIEWVEEVHEFLSIWVLFSVFAHVAGVILESRRLKVNLVKTMLLGDTEQNRKE